MGAGSHKSIVQILNSKYSFAKEKREKCSVQVAVWRFAEEELELEMNLVAGTCMKWPYKFYSDEGYVVMVIQDDSQLRSGKNLGDRELGTQLPNGLLFSAAVSQILYTFLHGFLEQYHSHQLFPMTHLPVSSEQQNLRMHVYLYVGDHLLPIHRLKLATLCDRFIKYVEYGGKNSIAKLYHEYDQLQDISEELKIGVKDAKKQAGRSDYMVKLEALLEDTKESGGAAQKEEAMKKIYQKLLAYDVLAKVVFEHCPAPVTARRLSLLNLYSCIPHAPYQEHLLIKKQQEEKVKTAAQVPSEPNLDDSSPFLCQITEINVKAKPKTCEMSQSSIMGEGNDLLKENKVQFVKVSSDSFVDFYLTDYFSVRDYSILQSLNIRLVLNCDAANSYNYFMNDIDYSWHYLEKIAMKLQPNPAQHNVECLIVRIAEAATMYSRNIKEGKNNVGVALYSGMEIFGEESVAIAIGYLIVKRLDSFEKAYETLSRIYLEQYKTKEKYVLHQIYCGQLKILADRVQAINSPSPEIPLLPNNLRVYHIIPYNKLCQQHLVVKYLGEISNINQLQCINNYPKNCFLIVVNGVTQQLTNIIDKLEKEEGKEKTFAHFQGLKVMVGKECHAKEQLAQFAKKYLPLLLKYEFFNRKKHQGHMDSDYFLKTITNLVEASLQVETIEKTFRRPAAFITLPYSSFEVYAAKTGSKLAPEPFKQKQKITFKYPILRPVWQKLRNDSYYFVISRTGGGANVSMVKGQNWIGLQNDKDEFFERIVKLYLRDIPEDKIWIINSEEESIFVGDLSITYQN